MPLHDFQCPEGHISEHFVGQGVHYIMCPECGSGHAAAEKVFLRAPMGYVTMDIHYRSPIDDAPITSARARIEDLAKHGCRPYETGEKEAMLARKASEERAFDKRLDSSIDETLAHMPARAREKLAAEMESGVDVEFIRV